MVKGKKIASVLLLIILLTAQVTSITPAFAVDAPANFAAELQSNTAVKLTWQVVNGATGYKVYQSSNGSTYNEIAQLAPTDTLFTVENLSAYTTYYFRVTTLMEADESGASTVQLTTDSDLPTAPANLEVVGTPTSTSVALRWTASTDGSGSVRYKIFSKQQGNEYSLRTTTTQTQYTVNNLQPQTQYFFYIVAVDNANHESADNSNTVIVDTPADTSSPTAPGGVTVTPLSSNQIRITWNAASDNVGIVGYEVYRGTSGNGTFTLRGSVSGSALTYTDTGVSANTNYYYKVRAYDSAGNKSAFSNTASNSLDTQKPQPPTEVWAKATSSDEVKLTWSGASDNKAVVSFEIYRATGSSTSYSRIGTDTASPYYDNGVSSNKVYKYRIAAVDAAGNISVVSDTVSVTTNGDTQVPSKPANLSVTLESNTEVRLTWNSSSDNKGVSGYRIFRSMNSGDFEHVANTTSLRYNDSGLSSGKTYKYYVKAYDAAGNESSASDTQSIYTSTSGRSEEETISSSSSGTLEIDDLFKLDVPSYALDQTVEYRVVTKQFSSYTTTGYKTFGQPVEATCKDGSRNITSFDKDLTITFYYTSSELGSTDTSKLKIYYWDTSKDKWVPLESTVNTSSKKVTAKTDHFTVFALLADTSNVSVPTLSNSTSASKRIVELYGKAGSNNKVYIDLNGSVTTVNARSDGSFTKEVLLAIGYNVIKIKAEDSSGKQSGWSSSYSIQCIPVMSVVDIGSHWAEYNVQKVLELGITSGYSDKTFRPNNNITRAEFAKFVVSALGLNPVSQPKLTFKDKKKIPEWAAGYIAKAISEGIMAGYDDGNFRANQLITRQEMASMLIRALKLQDRANELSYADLDFEDEQNVSRWARGAVALAVDKGLIKGYSDGTFGPANKASRAEAATMILKLLDLR